MGGTRDRPRIGLALAGGGPHGAIWEIGALRALDESFEGIELHRLDVYVGVSAGSFLAAALANGVRPAQLCRAIVKHEPGEHPFAPETFFAPAAGAILRGGLRVPGLFFESLVDVLRNPDDLGLIESLTRLSRALPVGLFDNEPIRRYLARVLSIRGRTDDFRELDRTLIVVAADLDSGRAVRFGEPGLDHVPISTAVQASTALPGLYPPVRIDGRDYLDGVLLKTLHGSVALDAEVDLLLCLNPIVPVDARQAHEDGSFDGGRLADRGLPAILSQTFRTLIHSRLVVGMAAYAPRYPGQDIVLLEPDRDDIDMFLSNVFSFSSRRRVCEHAYRATLATLARRREELEPALARHGVRLRDDVLDDPDRDLWRGVGIDPDREKAPVSVTLDRALDRLERLVDRPL